MIGAFVAAGAVAAAAEANEMGETQSTENAVNCLCRGMLGTGWVRNLQLHR